MPPSAFPRTLTEEPSETGLLRVRRRAALPGRYLPARARDGLPIGGWTRRQRSSARADRDRTSIPATRSSSVIACTRAPGDGPDNRWGVCSTRPVCPSRCSAPPGEQAVGVQFAGHHVVAQLHGGRRPVTSPPPRACWAPSPFVSACSRRWPTRGARLRLVTLCSTPPLAAWRHALIHHRRRDLAAGWCRRSARSSGPIPVFAAQSLTYVDSTRTDLLSYVRAGPKASCLRPEPAAVRLARALVGSYVRRLPRRGCRAQPTRPGTDGHGTTLTCSPGRAAPQPLLDVLLLPGGRARRCSSSTTNAGNPAPHPFGVAETRRTSSATTFWRRN